MPNVKNIISLKQTIVFYDGSCPLCQKEIRHYIRIDHSRSINWVDISINTSLLTHYDIAFKDAMKKLHAVEVNGDIRIGIDAFLTIWQLLPYYQYLAKIVLLFKLKKPMTWTYNIFAKQRYKKYVQRQLCTTACDSLIK